MHARIYMEEKVKKSFKKGEKTLDGKERDVV